MAKIKLLIDTDVFIDYLNKGFLSPLFEDKGFENYYSVVTKKELLSKSGLKDSARQAILLTLQRYRIIPLKQQITVIYSELRRKHPSLGKADTLIAATALSRKLPLVTRNWKHYKNIEGLTVFKGTTG